jgi:hypothetical protein
MTTEKQIPSEIEDIILEKKFAIEQEHHRKLEEDARAQAELILSGQLKFAEYFKQSLTKLPEWIRPYVNLTDHAPDYERIGKGWDRVEGIDLYISIPGLATIIFDPQKGQYRSAVAHWHNASWEEEPRIVFGNSSYWRNDLEYTLIEAQREFQEYQKDLAQFAIAREEKAREWARRDEYEKAAEARAAEAAAKREIEQAKEKAEEQALFEALKGDPIAMHLLKAFILLRDERSTFEQQIYAADEAAYSIENRWSRKAEELRRQAAEAERRAEDEKSRLQSDLDEIEAKLKKSQRGW